jgi:hypothetical protein
MPLTDESIARLKETYPSLVVLARDNEPAPQPRNILAVRVTVDGIRGGRSTARCAYRLIIDTRTMSSEIPPVWIAAPSDDEIKHVNELYSKPIPRGASGESFDSVKYHDTPPAVLERQRPSRKNPRVQSKGFSGKRENRCATIVPLA